MNCPLPYQSHGCFQISASDFSTVSRGFHTCAYEFLTMETEGVVHGIHKVAIWSSFVVIEQHKVS